MRNWIDLLEIYRRPASTYDENVVAQSLNVDTTGWVDLGTFDDFEVKSKEPLTDFNEAPIAVLRGGEIIAVLDAYDHDGMLVTSGIGVRQDSRGENIAARLYGFLVRHCRATLLSDHRHTPGGEAVWKMLTREPGVEIAAMNTATNEITKIESIQDVYRDDFLAGEDDYIELDENPHFRLVAKPI